MWNQLEFQFHWHFDGPKEFLMFKEDLLGIRNAFESEKTIFDGNFS